MLQTKWRYLANQVARYKGIGKYDDYQQATRYRNDLGPYAQADMRILCRGWIPSWSRSGSGAPSIERDAHRPESASGFAFAAGFRCPVPSGSGR
jgi:hypothetical protein